jgi:fructose-1,6-bisphosphatase
MKDILLGFIYFFFYYLYIIYFYRYVGSKVADFNRTLLYGGILIYGSCEINILEALTFSFLIEKAWNRFSFG